MKNFDLVKPLQNYEGSIAKPPENFLEIYRKFTYAKKK